MQLPRYIAHRGLSAHAPENTLAAIQAASDASCEWVELDVQCLGDGTPVIWHDASVDRCSNGKGALINMTRNDIRPLDVGSWFSQDFRGERMALLDEALSLVSALGLGLNLELKINTGHDPAALARVAVHRARQVLPLDQLLVSSFDMSALETARAEDEALALGLLYEAVPRRWASDAERLRPTSVHADWTQLDQERLIEIQAAELAMLCYTVNEPERFSSWWDHGVTGVFTDDPGLFDTRYQRRTRGDGSRKPR
ncbi:glycerophosphodiester phosphodiesterase family protein [Kushneria marisflavi]|uniref:Glycerophosphoryl diester phosphodiesterase n=1 Tax=Kushneria marisflavi TaxID=157779 RepID=A0A240USS5_9GAMM|nr:glycerophosphodiester phosphodiesterase family protein [Kushneria marisflavi]ART64186.1 glycerophosphoryl diester phosphodiesterase [Kushneria marisflavi]RKD76641.1 glycerophosphoryl diester phosphodiesterase [Kushneria marisflavi]